MMNGRLHAMTPYQMVDVNVSPKMKKKIQQTFNLNEMLIYLNLIF
jgi:hypothetical protein